MSTRARSIQFVRAAAAMSIVLLHTTRVANDTGGFGLALPQPLCFGELGVDVFFVVSGFVIAHITAGKPFVAGDFLARRFWRIVPLYWLCSATFLLMVGVYGAPAGYSAATIAPSFALLPQPGFPLLGVGWSIEHELVFYVIAAAALFAGQSLMRVMIALSIAAVAWHVAARDVRWDYHLLSLYHVEFLAGIVLHRMRGYVPRVDWRLSTGAAVIGLSLTHLAVVNHVVAGTATQTSGEGWLGLLRVGGAAAASVLLIGGLLRAEEDQQLTFGSRAGRAAIALGDASYSLYLTHTLTFMVLGKVFGAMHAPTIVAVPPSIALAVVVAIACHRWVEVPLMSRVARRNSPAPSAGGTVC